MTNCLLRPIVVVLPEETFSIYSIRRLRSRYTHCYVNSQFFRNKETFDLTFAIACLCTKSFLHHLTLLYNLVAIRNIHIGLYIYVFELYLCLVPCFTVVMRNPL